MIVSGAALHVCPTDAFEPVALRSVDTKVRLRNASGEVVPVLGTKRILLRHSDVTIPSTFIVTAVNQPIVSISQLMNIGCSVSFGRNGCNIVLQDG